jgi:hypothetical protein
MKPTPELVFALRRAAARIIDPKENYSWFEPSRCNCGLLVREICGLSEDELTKERCSPEGHISVWSRIREDEFDKCSSTGLSMTFIWETLKSVGFEFKDFLLIEKCNLKEGEKMKFRTDFTPYILYTEKDFVHDFFLELANELESQLPLNQHHKRENECINENRNERELNISRINTSEPVKS